MDKTLTTLSVVVPIYNVENYLDACLKSLGTLLNNETVEIILVNDGSSDSSGRIARSYADNFKSVYYYEKHNGGLSDARNYGMTYVRGKYVVFLDSDDRIDDCSLLDALNFMVLNNLDWLQCAYAYDYEDYLLSYKNKNVSEVLTKEDVLKSLVADGVIKNFAWGKIYRAEIIKKIKFPKGKYYEDAFWQFRVIDKSERFGFFPRIVCFYRVRQESISAKFSLRSLDLLEGLNIRLKYLIDNYPHLAPLAALGLWHIARDYAYISKRFPNQTMNSFVSAVNNIENTYPDLIESGIFTQPLLLRIADFLCFKHYTLIAWPIIILRKVIERFRPSEFNTLKIK